MFGIEAFHCIYIYDNGQLSRLGPPTIDVSPGRTVVALIGQRVMLECTAQGDPTPGVYWVEPMRRRRGDVEPDAVDYSPTPGSAVVDIASVDREDEGTYRCVASNTGGTSEVLVQLSGIYSVSSLCCLCWIEIILTS